MTKDTHTEGYWLCLIEKHWEDIGDCRSCGWHAKFREHNLDGSDIKDALEDGGNMTVYCISDDENSVDHRGARFNLYELEKL